MFHKNFLKVWDHIRLSSVFEISKHSFDPWVRKIPWKRKSQHTPVFLSGKSHGQRNLAGYTTWGLKSQTQLSNSACTKVERVA